MVRTLLKLLWLLMFLGLLKKLHIAPCLLHLIIAQGISDAVVCNRYICSAIGTCWIVADLTPFVKARGVHYVLAVGALKPVATPVLAQLKLLPTN